jgi:cobalt-zinc-cadmium efflux system protein
MKTARKIRIAFLLNLAFSVFEFVGGAITGSIAILSDAVHDMGDAFSIGVSFALEKLSHKKAYKKYTYGYYRYSLLGSALQSAILLCGSLVVAYNAVMRFVFPRPIDYNGMILIAVIGFFVNFVAAWFTSGEGSLNQKAINLHMLEDVLGWAIVLIGAVVMRFTDWWFLDPALSFALAVFIGFHALKNLKAVGDVFLEKTPEGIDPEEITHHLEELPGVESIHHLHIWSMDGYRHSATLHAVVTGEYGPAKRAIKEELHEHGITHSTVELESPGEHCEDPCCQPATHTHHHHCH